MSDPRSLVQVDETRPWLGLLPFKEEHRAFFFGRDEEIREILQRIRDNTLTILFGQSGLGKSSLIGAGIIPKLREGGFSAIHLRLDYVKGSPPLLEQTRRAFRKILPESAWPENAAEITLWELFHQSPGFADADCAQPVLIFDQFEEIFTLGKQEGHGDESAEWLAQVADLIQNRPPASLEDKFAENRRLARGYDFSEAAFRIVFALREDYLSHLEAWKPQLPLLMQNRMPLTLLNGQQALQAVLGPASLGLTPLVSREVAADIIRTVADVPAHTPLAGISAVPPLLSLLCEQLNEARLTAGIGELGGNLVKERSADILQTFYEESYASFPTKERELIRSIIENPPMVTEGGFRNSLVREDAEKELAANGVANPKAAFDTLIQRRLITAEDKAGLQRLEITHDVLVPLVVRSRKERREREATEKARKQRLKMRRVVGGLLLLVVFLAVSYAWALMKSFEAVEAVDRMENAEQHAASNRSWSLEMVKFLIRDLNGQLMATGRTDMIIDVQDRVADFFETHDAPKDPEEYPYYQYLHSEVLVSCGDFNANQGHLDKAAQAYSVAVSILRKLVETDPDEAEWQRNLGISLMKVGDVDMALGETEKAAQAYAECLIIRRKLAEALRKPEEAEQAFSKYSRSYYRRDSDEEYLEKLRGLAGLPRNLPDWWSDNFYRRMLAEEVLGRRRDLVVSLNKMGGVAEALGKTEEATQAYTESLALRKKLEEEDPNYTQLQHDLGVYFHKEGEDTEAQGDLTKAASAYITTLWFRRRLAEFDPDNIVWQHNLSLTLRKMGNIAEKRGNFDEVAQAYGDSLKILRNLVEADPKRPEWHSDLGNILEKVGDVAEAQRKYEETARAYAHSLLIHRELAEFDLTNKNWRDDFLSILDKVVSANDMRGISGYEKTAQAYGEALSLHRKYAEADPENQTRQRDLGYFLYKVGYFAHKLGKLDEADLRIADLTPDYFAHKFDEAGQAFAEAVVISRRLAEADPDNAELQSNLSLNLFNVGLVAQDKGELNEAAQAFAEDLAITRKLLQADPDNKERQHYLSYSLDHVGDVAKARKELDAASQAYAECLVIIRKLTETDPQNTELLRSLSNSLSKVGDVAQARGKLDEAAQAFAEELSITRKLAEADPEHLELQFNISFSLCKVGDVARARGELDQAAVAFDECLAIRRKLVEARPYVSDWQTELVESLRKSGSILVDMEKKEDAIARFMEALEITRRLKSKGELNASQKGWEEIFEKAIKDLE